MNSQSKKPKSQRPNNTLPFKRIANIKQESDSPPWLIESIWQRKAVGIVGGQAKLGKSWLGLDMAISVASATPCLGHFPVHDSGPVLIYLAEDSLHDVRTRVEGICRKRAIDVNTLKLYTITSHSLQLDQTSTQQKLRETVDYIKPRLLLLDPLIRLHSADENNSGEISKLLHFLRGLQRNFNMAIVLVHHANKRQSADPGQSLRGSSDLFAWTDSTAFLKRANDCISLSLRHRSNQSPKPFTLALVTENSNTFLTLVETSTQLDQTQQQTQLVNRITAYFNQNHGPITRTALRAALKVNNQKLGSTLSQLKLQGIISQNTNGWSLA